MSPQVCPGDRGAGGIVNGVLGQDAYLGIVELTAEPELVQNDVDRLVIVSHPLVVGPVAWRGLGGAVEVTV